MIYHVCIELGTQHYSLKRVISISPLIHGLAWAFILPPSQSFV